MILQFRNKTNQVISGISTKDRTIDLNMHIDFESLSEGSGRILYNSAEIGTFSRTAGSPVQISIHEGNFTRPVNDGDTFDLVVDVPTGIATTARLVVDRVNLPDVTKLPSVLKEVVRFLDEPDFPNKLTNVTQRNILQEYDSDLVPMHVPSFVKELLDFTLNIPDPDTSTFPTPDTFYCSNGIPLIIPVASILTNDKVRSAGQIVSNSAVDMLEIIAVKNVTGGSATPTLFNGKISSIRFVNSAPVGSTGSFVCEIKNKITNEIFESNISIYIKAPHPINAIGDVYNLTQWGTLNITKTQLMANDTSIYPPVTFVEIIPYSTVRGTITVVGDTISFVGTGLAGQAASFQYRIKDARNNTAIGLVTINVLELPAIEAYLFSTAEAANFRNSYIPPTLAEIFSTWGRFSNNGLYFPPGTTPTGEAASWERYLTGFRCTVNSVYMTGFVSPKEYDTYTHEATLSSTAVDDDTIALVIAFKRDGSTNRALLAIREPGGMVSYTGSTSWSLATNINGVITKIASLASPAIIKKTGNWNVVGKSRVRVERIGSMVTIQCSQFGTTSILAGSKIEIDLTNYPDLAWALDPCFYGYACQSQQYSTYADVLFEGGINASEIFDFDLNCTWEYINNVWVQNTSKTIQSVLGYPRTITNPVNGFVYRIEQNYILRLS